MEKKEKITITPLDGRNANMFEVQRDIWDKLYSVIAECDNIGEITVNGAIGAMFRDMSGYTMVSREMKNDNPDAIVPIGMIAGIIVKVDPNMRFNDTRVLMEGLEITIEIDPMQIV